MTSQHTTSPSGTCAPAGSRSAEPVRAQSNANFFKIVALQLRGWALLILLVWPLLIWTQFWASDADSPDDISLLILSGAAIFLGAFSTYFGWEPYRLRALSLTSQDIQKSLLTVKVCGIGLTQIVMWISVWFWFPLSSTQGKLLVGIVTIVNALILMLSFRDAQPLRTEVVQDAKIENKDDDVSRRWTGVTATELLIDQPLKSVARWTGAIGTGAILVGCVTLLIVKDPSVNSWAIVVAICMTVAIAFTGSLLEDMLRNWLTFSGSRATWFQRVAKKRLY